MTRYKSFGFLYVGVTPLWRTQLLEITMWVVDGAYLKIFWANMVR